MKRDKLALKLSRLGTEVWQTIPGYEGHYEVSNLGAVRSLDRWLPHARYGTRFNKGRVLKQSAVQRGYKHVILCKGDGIQSTIQVHQLVMLTFCGRPPSGKVCLHGDGQHGHNALHNLRYGTHVENCEDRHKHQTGMDVLTKADVIVIKRKIRRGYTDADIAGRYGVHPNTIGLIRKGRNWRHVL